MPQDSKPGNDLAISGVWQLSRLQRSLALMMLTWATRLQDPVLASQVRRHKCLHACNA